MFETPDRSTPTATTFEPGDGFLVGDENVTAYRAALAMARLDAGMASPLLIVGASGTGKTRLVRGLAAEWRSRQPQAASAAITGEEFSSACGSARGTEGGWPALRAQLRALDLLAIDDVEGVAGWPVAVEELIHVIQSIHGAGGRLVFATRHPPSRWDAEPRALVHRLVSLLMGGVLVTLETPGAALRRRFVLEQIQGRGIALAAEAVDWLVAAADGFRTLEGWVTRLSFWARAQAPSSALRRMSLEQVGALLQDDAALVRPACAEMQTIAQAVAARFRVSVKALLGASRRRDVVEPRHLAILLAKAHTANSQAAIGRFFGARDPKTVRHACQAAQTRIERDPRWAAAAHDLARALAGQDAAAISHTLRPGDEWY